MSIKILQYFSPFLYFVLVRDLSVLRSLGRLTPGPPQIPPPPSLSDLTADARKLPVWNMKDQLLAAIHHNQVILVCGETGSGKTTQVCVNSQMMHCSFARGNTLWFAYTSQRRLTLRILYLIDLVLLHRFSGRPKFQQDNCVQFPFPLLGTPNVTSGSFIAWKTLSHFLYTTQEDIGPDNSRESSSRTRRESWVHSRIPNQTREQVRTVFLYFVFH